MVLRVRIVISDAGRGPNRCFAVSANVPGKSKPRSKLPPVPFSSALARESRIAREREPQWSFLEHAAPRTGGTGLLAVPGDITQGERLSKIGLPAQPVIQSPALIHFPAISKIERHVPLSHVVHV